MKLFVTRVGRVGWRSKKAGCEEWFAELVWFALQLQSEFSRPPNELVWITMHFDHRSESNRWICGDTLIIMV